MSKNLFFGFNWKANPKTFTEAMELSDQYGDLYDKLLALPNTNLEKTLNYAVFPTDLAVPLLSPHQKTLIGIQDVSTNTNGAWTGQTTAVLAQTAGCHYAIIGHSETRLQYALTNSTLNQKIKATLDAQLIPVICTAFVNEESANAELTADLVANLQDIDVQSEFIVAFEPLASIGGSAMKPDQVNDYLAFIKSVLVNQGFNNFIVLYGGGVNPSNVLELSKCENVDGFLVGGASLKIDQVEALLTIANDYLSTVN